ncbi:MAG TPA: hypothetical protein VGW40_00910 [Allosphingosinicella sp.]|nr:hypothetical protein [Allosphingosinicella sp.]
MNDFSEVQVQLDAQHNLTIRLIGANTSVDDVAVTVPADLLEDFRFQIDRVLGS